MRGEEVTELVVKSTEGDGRKKRERMGNDSNEVIVRI